MKKLRRLPQKIQKLRKMGKLLRKKIKKASFPEEKEKKEDAVKAQINELQDKVMRQMAEFENFRKRSEKEKSAMFEIRRKECDRTDPSRL